MTTNNLDNTYMFVFRKNTNQQFVKIIAGPLSGAVIDYKKITIPRKPSPDGNFHVKLDYDFVEMPIEMPENKDIVSQVLGDVAMDILINYQM